MVVYKKTSVMGITEMHENTINIEAFKLKGRLYTFTVLQLLNTDKDLIAEQFAATVIQAPKLFESTPVVFDLSLVKGFDVDLKAICKIARGYGMIPVAIQGEGDFLAMLANDAGLAVLNGSSSHDRPIIERPRPQSTEFTKSKLFTTPIRSGQQVVAKATDLIVTSAVSHGAELLADGSIHVYGPLRGRALAGISGDREARIFCQSLEAQLVAIAGFYRLSDALEPLQVPCQIYLIDEHIHIEPL